jgi:AraC-like DNA-binding protein
MVLHIKNMVCDRCKTAVQTQLINLGLNPVSIKLGEVIVQEKAIPPQKIDELNKSLSTLGFELLANPKEKLVEEIKTTIIELVHYNSEPLKVNLSAFLSDKLVTDYQTLSTTFSEIEQNTIEKYFIQQKIEKVKELLSYGEKTLSEIAYLLNYSSVAHLSSQFKKVIGITPSQFKLLSTKERKTLDEV